MNVKTKTLLGGLALGILGGIWTLTNLCAPSTMIPVDVQWVSKGEYSIRFCISDAKAGHITHNQIDTSIFTLSEPVGTREIGFYVYDEYAQSVYAGRESSLDTGKLHFLFAGRYQYCERKNELVLKVVTSEIGIPIGTKIYFKSAEGLQNKESG